MTIKLRRSALYMPGANRKMLAKAHSQNVDVLVFDLEDSVGPQDKTIARENIAEAVDSNRLAEKETIVRVNSLGSEWGADDVVTMSRIAIDGLLFPKIESPNDVSVIVQALSDAGSSEMPIWLMIETPRAIVEIAAISSACDRIECLMIGTADLAKEARIVHTPNRDGLVTALSHCVMAARAYGLDIMDGVHFQLKDEPGFRRACLQGRELGFDGKSLIHPSQVDEANRIFSPSSSAVEEAEKIVESWRHAQTDGKSMVVVDGKLVEHLHVTEAQRILELDSAIKQRAQAPS